MKTNNYNKQSILDNKNKFYCKINQKKELTCKKACKTTIIIKTQYLVIIKEKPNHLLTKTLFNNNHQIIKMLKLLKRNSPYSIS